MKFRTLMVLIVFMLSANVHIGVAKNGNPNPVSTPTSIKQQNLNKLLEVMQVDAQVAALLDSVMRVIEELLLGLDTATSNLPNGKNINKIVMDNYKQFRINAPKAINHRKIYLRIYDKNFTNEEIVELINIFSTNTGKKFIKTNMATNDAVLSELHPLISDYVAKELPKINAKIMKEVLNSDSIDKMMNDMTTKFRKEIKDIMQ